MGGSGDDLLCFVEFGLCREIYGKNLNKDFINAVRGGGHRFMKLFHKIPLFFERWLPLMGNAVAHINVKLLYFGLPISLIPRLSRFAWVQKFK